MSKQAVDGDSLRLVLDDSRRLTGKNFFMDQSGAVLDALISGVDPQQVVALWLEQVSELLVAVGWADTQRFYRIFEGGVSLGFAAAQDTLYAAVALNEAAWQRCCLQLKGEGEAGSSELSATVQELRAMIDEERHPLLSALITGAEERQVPFLVDDDVFSLGLGRTSQRWDVTQLPDPASLDWSQYRRIPLAMVTGTNGKSTSVRLIAHMLNTAGLCCGVTSTDFIRVGDTVLDKGDYSGPGGARMLLRHPEVEAGVLEVARGGLLRRGLPVPYVDVALVTNVAEDHLGQYGINSVAELTATKMLVAKAAGRQLILNADDNNLVSYVAQCPAAVTTESAAIPLVPLAKRLPPVLGWFALNENNTVLQAAREAGQPVAFVRDGWLFYAIAAEEQPLLAVNDMPMTLSGAARHNVQNALGALLVAKALGVGNVAIVEALAGFNSDAGDNPGRGNQFDCCGGKVILDFAHNVHGMDAMADTVRCMPAQRRTLVLCHAGDRSDAEITAMTHSAMQMQPDQVWVCELADYLRGREPGEVPALISRTVEESGLPARHIHHAEDLVQATRQIIGQMAVGDVVFMMALSRRDEIVQLLTEQMA